MEIPILKFTLILLTHSSAYFFPTYFYRSKKGIKFVFLTAILKSIVINNELEHYPEIEILLNVLCTTNVLQ